MKKIFLLIAAVFFVLSISSARDGFAAIYKYIDKDGVVCFADDLQSVPEKYRVTAVIFSGEMKGEPKLSAKGAETHDEGLSAAPAVRDASSLPAREEKPFSKRLANTIIIMTVLVVMYVVLERLKEVIESSKYHKLVSLARIALSAVAVLYLVFAHVSDVIHGVAGIGKSVEEVKEQSAKKGRNTAKALKTLDALLGSAEKERVASSPASENNE